MTPPCVVPTFRPYAAENLEFGGFYASSCESRVSSHTGEIRIPASSSVADAAMTDDRRAVGQHVLAGEEPAHDLAGQWQAA